MYCTYIKIRYHSYYYIDRVLIRFNYSGKIYSPNIFLQIRHGLKSAFQCLVLTSVKRWRISCTSWNKITYLWSPVCNSFGSKFNTSYCQNTETENSDILGSSDWEKQFLIGGDSPLTNLHISLVKSLVQDLFDAVFAFDVSKISEKELQ